MEYLEMNATNVTELSPIADCPIRFLLIDATKITHWEPLRKMPLEELQCPNPTPELLAVLKALPKLKTINGRPAAEVLK